MAAGAAAVAADVGTVEEMLELAEKVGQGSLWGSVASVCACFLRSGCLSLLLTPGCHLSGPTDTAMTCNDSPSPCTTRCCLHLLHPLLFFFCFGEAAVLGD